MVKPECESLARRLASARQPGGYALAPYPLGLVAMDEHEPWASANMREVLLLVIMFVGARLLLRGIAPTAGRAIGRTLHGRAWAGARTVDWRRFADEAYYTVVHALLVLYALCSDVGPEVLVTMRGSSVWLACEQPAMSEALRRYMLLQAAFNIESLLVLAYGVAVPRGSAPDRAMIMHHGSTIVLIVASWRLHFVRVGAAISLLHDVTDLPIDGIRLSQALGASLMLYASAASALLLWAVGRLVLFPICLMLPCLFSSRHFLQLVTRRSGVAVCGLIHVLFGVPLILLYVLHIYWYRMLVRKVLRHAGRHATAHKAHQG